ncbi:hypothetical protein KCTC52924_02524 [Arenibacter antarcticus]|nr:DUF922 domain-containing protein [Arenibacter sp. H213]
MVLALFLVVEIGFGQQEGGVLWQQGNRLKWSDFKGKPSLTSNAAAVTASGITYSFSSLNKNGKIEVDFKVDAHFYPENSWVRSTTPNTAILNHEQLHFDITEIYTRKLRREFAKATFTKNTKSEVRGIYRQILKELSNYQNRYDKETNFSRNQEKQMEWNKRIKLALGQ